ncbi:MAG: hypothetical protein LBE44_04165 [Microbacterium hominis]|uniref:hypothetical protein n=1 Tax=Microbacterium aurum TaxID=36805 RepID=UPI00248D8D7A|nr:hypothetical protein [Microbacterium aurum]MBZ6371094.1 hypothetical protein [Microbacterium hominis]
MKDKRIELRLRDLGSLSFMSVIVLLPERRIRDQQIQLVGANSRFVWQPDHIFDRSVVLSLSARCQPFIKAFSSFV